MGFTVPSHGAWAPSRAACSNPAMGKLTTEGKCLNLASRCVPFHRLQPDGHQQGERREVLSKAEYTVTKIKLQVNDTDRVEKPNFGGLFFSNGDLKIFIYLSTSIVFQR